MNHIPQHSIRTLFSRAMSAMYKKEVPQYDTLIKIVEDVNDNHLKKHPDLKDRLRKIT